MAEVGWSVEAANDLLSIRRYIAEFDPGAANAIALRLGLAAASLADFPDRGRPAQLGVRELVTVPPYVTRYEHVESVVTILSIRYGRRRSVQTDPV